MKQNALSSLIRLIDDPDEGIFYQIRDRVISLGDSVIPALETAWEKNKYGALFQERVEEIIQSIQYHGTYEGLKTWKEYHSTDLLKGLIILAKHRYPDTDEQKIHDFINKIEKDVWIELNPNLTALEQIKVLNHIFFDVYGFEGDVKDYHALENSFINKVIERRSGNPISISLIYMMIANRLNIPLYGINLPRHFVLAYCENSPGDEKNEANILFYVNPFSNGGIFNQEDIIRFLDQIKLPHNTDFYTPCSNDSIMSRILNNIKYSFELKEREDKMDEYEKLRALFSV